MKYIRTKNGIYENNGLMQSNSTIEENSIIVCGGHFAIPMSKIIKKACTIEELIQIGDIVFYWSSNDDKEHAHLIRCNMEIIIFRREVITKLLIPVGEDYKCVAKGYPSFNLIRNKRYLVNKGELELI